MYKSTERYKECVALFNPDKGDIIQRACDIIKHSTAWGRAIADDEMLYQLEAIMTLLIANISQRSFLPEEWTRETYAKFIEDFDVLAPKREDDGAWIFGENGGLELDPDVCVIRSNQYRQKASSVELLSLMLYLNYNEFKPMLLPQRFDIVEKNCDALGIDMPELPHSNDYRAYLMFYYDICMAWNAFQQENGLTDAELCACVYDFASQLHEATPQSELPRPTNVWFTGGSGGDFRFLDSMGKDNAGNSESIWACNERTRRGDIVVMYCLSPRSYIHSIWRSNSGGIFNPFDHYHCRTTLCDGVEAPHISIKDLKADAYMSQLPIVRRNLQGLNGIELTSQDYTNLLRMIEERGGDIASLPKLIETGSIDFGEIALEKDVEEKILIPMLKRLGYAERDWTRQLSLKAGRSEKAIPDFVFLASGERHFENAPMVIEAKLDMAPVRELQKAFNQGLSYARMLRSSIMGLCDKERLVLYRVDGNGSADRNNPLFEEHWAVIYADVDVAARLNQLIGREVLAAQ